jgi:glycerophosphoryl diester phosphodiesterase
VPHPEIIAHRGASRERPENTLAAFRRALELGADAVELDVHRSADGVLFVHHDPVPAAPPSSEFAGLAIPSLTSEQLARFRVRGEPIPTLDAVVRAVGSALIVYCELKGPGTALAAAKLLAASGPRAAVHAFDHRQVAAARVAVPALARGVLEASYHVDPVWPLASVGARDLWQQWDMIDDALVDAVHARGGRVIAWTVDGEREMADLAAMGVDALCTNDVALARTVLGR